MHKLQKKILSKIYSGYGCKYYPTQFQKKFKLNHKYHDQKTTLKLKVKLIKF